MTTTQNNNGRSANGHGRNRVRFAANPASSSVAASVPSNTSNNNKAVPQRPPKRPRMERPNPDEEDDIDDWENDHDPEDEPAVSSKQLNQAKRARRLKRDGSAFVDDEYEQEEEEFENQRGPHGGKSTHAVEGEEVVDAATSLLAEQHNSSNPNNKNNETNDEIPVEPFNLDQERSDGSGYFVGDTYVFRKRDTDEEPDAWLEALDERTKEDKPTMTTTTQTAPNSDDDKVSKGMDSWNHEQLYELLVSLMTTDENVLQALVRYGEVLKRQKKQAKNNTKSAIGSATTSKNDVAQRSLDNLTGASNALLLKGDVDIYQKTREDLVALLPASTTQTSTKTGTTEDVATTTVKPTVQWEYKGNQDGQIHGPYTTDQLKSWTQAGYFVGTQAVQIRTVSLLPLNETNKNGDSSHTKKKKSNVDDLLSDLMEDDDDDGNDDDNNNNKQKSPTQHRGEWVSSNDVNFSLFS
mmetsp:Transcript_6601/g.10036  ORF Transcript_6601/g.10036 Transcript_6601/m.10036 type:complete len:466 (-) Transcript_6601:29-1426(-)